MFVWNQEKILLFFCIIFATVCSMSSPHHPPTRASAKGVGSEGTEKDVFLKLMMMMMMMMMMMKKIPTCFFFVPSYKNLRYFFPFLICPSYPLGPSLPPPHYRRQSAHNISKKIIIKKNGKK